MTITYYPEIIQGSDEWTELRRGKLTASSVNLILTPTLKQANNDKTRAQIYELAAQRISGFVEASYYSDDMLRGYDDEVRARDLYSKHYAPVEQTGFITNDKWGFIFGFSPDGLVGDDGLIEVKSRRQKFQIELLTEHTLENTIPQEYILQIQTGLLVSERAWCDFISYSGGLPMVTIRVYPDAKIQDAIVEAAMNTEAAIQEKMAKFQTVLKSEARLIPTERTVEKEIFV